MSASQKIAEIFTAYGARIAPAAGVQMRIDAKLVWDLLLEAEANTPTAPTIDLEPYKRQIIDLQQRLSAAHKKIAALESSPPPPPVVVTVVEPEKPKIRDTVKTIRQRAEDVRFAFVVTRDQEFTAHAIDCIVTDDFITDAHQAYLAGQISWDTYEFVKDKKR